MMVTSGIHAALAGTKPWVRLCSVLLFVTAALVILVGLIGGALAGSTFGEGPEMAAVGVFYAFMGLLYFFPALYLYRYASRIGDYLAGGEEAQLEHALDAQRSFWKFVGIVTLAGLVLIALTIVAAVAIPTMMGLPGR